MELFLLLVLGGGIYLFVKGKARRDMEMMRAHVFLDALERGEPLDEANSYARLVMGFEAPKGIILLSRMRMHDEFDGKWSHMVGSAYGQGMTSKLSGFEREFFELKPRYAGPVTRPETFKSRMEMSQGRQLSQRRSTDHGQPSNEAFPSDYKSYYATYIAELKRLSGMTPDQHHQAELMEEIGEATGDNLTRQNFESGIDPKEYAADVHAMMQRNQPASDFADFDSYFATYIAECRFLANTKIGRLHPAELMEKDGARLAYDLGVPPQTLAALHHDDQVHHQQG